MFCVHMQVGYVLFVNGEVEKMPESELAMDCVLPEGPPDKFEVMASLFNCIPRDADHTAEMWTTVDKDKTNVRAKAVYKLLSGFSLYLVLMGKNFIFESKTEARYRDLLIVCNVQVKEWNSMRPNCCVDWKSHMPHGRLRFCYFAVISQPSSDVISHVISQPSSGPVDLEGLYYMTASSNRSTHHALGASGERDPTSMKDVMEALEEGMDIEIFRRGVVRSNTNPKCRNKVCVCVCARV